MTQEIKEAALTFLKWFSTIDKTQSEVNIKEVGEYIAEDICFYLNGELLAKGLSAYCERINTLFSSIKSLQMHFPLVNLVVEDNQAAINYLETIVFKNGATKQLVNGMFLHFDTQGKINRLYDVFNGGDPAVS